jgi:hypothetical protein
MKKYILLFLFALTAIVHANAVYIAQNATGSANGSNAANALPVSYFNNIGNWTSEVPTGFQIGPGTVVHLCGLISTTLTVQDSGNNGNVITILFEPNASMSAPNWSEAAIICSQNYILIDGGTNGVIQATNQNSTSGLSSNGVSFTGLVNNCEVRNLSIINIYNKTSHDDSANNAGAGINIQAGSFLFIHDNIIINAGSGIWYGRQGGSTSTTVSIYNNTIS